jgi:fucose 4-O-acetylase-like acetyltransferase
MRGNHKNHGGSSYCVDILYTFFCHISCKEKNIQIFIDFSTFIRTFVGMKERKNWIDWAKFIAITMVVFGHIPENPHSTLFVYIWVFHMPLFFFISGYLAKRRTDTINNIKRHWNSLIIPYLLYNIIFYPYWLIRFILENNEVTIYNIVFKPLMGILLGQANSHFSSTVNLVTWFLAGLLIMRILVNLCNKYKYNILLMTIICFVSIVINVYDERYDIIHILLLKGLLSCIPFYILGHLLQNNHHLSNKSIIWSALISIVMFALSLLFFSIYKTDYNFTTKMTCWYFTCISSIFFILFLCKILNNVHHRVIITFSEGTIVIMGLHWMFIGTINYILQIMLSLNEGIGYNWYVAVFLSLLIDAFIYPIILFFQSKIPWMLGKRG